MNKTFHLILASESPRRRQLLRQAGYRFRVIPSKISENDSSRDPAIRVRRLSLQKATDVAGKLIRGRIPLRMRKRRRTVLKILGADTLVVLGKRILGKPDSAAHARKMLSRLSGTWHRVYTGVSVITLNPVEKGRSGGRLTLDKIRTGSAVSRVRMRTLDPAEIARYSRKHPDKAGGYAVQERKDPVVERIIGDYTNVVGLPMSLVKKLLA